LGKGGRPRAPRGKFPGTLMKGNVKNEKKQNERRGGVLVGKRGFN